MGGRGGVGGRGGHRRGSADGRHVFPRATLEQVSQLRHLGPFGLERLLAAARLLARRSRLSTKQVHTGQTRHADCRWTLVKSSVHSPGGPVEWRAGTTAARTEGTVPRVGLGRACASEKGRTGRLIVAEISERRLSALRSTRDKTLRPAFFPAFA